jgi:glycosyltransferase involved in cell wall biosynthesis
LLRSVTIEIVCVMSLLLFDAPGAENHPYARRMIAELSRAGHDATIADEAADDSLARLPAGTRALIDGPVLSRFTGRPDGELARAIGLVHQPESAAGTAAILPRLGRIITTGQATADALIAAGVSAARMRIVTPGTDDATRATGSAGGVCHILSVGACIPRKGHDVLLTALGRLTDIPWRLTIAGSAERDRAHAGSLSALATQLGLDARVTFAATADEALWRSADLFALASRWEPWPTSVAEALRRGLPLAVTDFCANAAGATQSAAVTAAPGDAEALSKGLRRMIFDAALRRYMADAAWSAGQALPTWETQARAFAAALDD